MHMTGIARLGRDAELRYTQQGEAVATLALAFDFMKSKEKKTQWVKASLWGKRAESLKDCLTKGTQCYFLLESPHIETYQKNDGTEGVNLIARVLDLDFAGGKNQGNSQQSAAPSSPPPAPRRPEPKQPHPMDDLDDDIPF